MSEKSEFVKKREIMDLAYPPGQFIKLERSFKVISGECVVEEYNAEEISTKESTPPQGAGIRRYHSCPNLYLTLTTSKVDCHEPWIMKQRKQQQAMSRSDLHDITDNAPGSSKALNMAIPMHHVSVQLGPIAYAIVSGQPVMAHQLLSLRAKKETDPISHLLIKALRAELKTAAARTNSGTAKLDPKQLVFFPKGTRHKNTSVVVHGRPKRGMSYLWDAQTSPGYDAVSGSDGPPRIQHELATETVRNTLAALFSRFNHHAAAAALRSTFQEAL